MAKTIKYQFNGNNVEMVWNEINELIAKAEAAGGEYTIEDDGVEETAQTTQEQRLVKLEKAIEDIPALIQSALKSILNT